MTADAANNGVGPSDSGSTGRARACEVHAQNKGKSNARGLDCATTTTSSTTTSSTTTTTIAESATLTGTWTRTATGGCQLDAAGTGLQPGSEVVIRYSDGMVGSLGTVSPSGDFTFSGDSTLACEEFTGTTLEGTTEAGEAISSEIVHAY